MMGCSPGDTECRDDEKPAHQVMITKGYWIGQTPVTQAAFQQAMGSNPSHFRGAELPVEQVTWDQSKNYCETVGARLPTEAEWEYAARAGNASSRYGEINAIAWWGQNSGATSHPVGRKQPNAWNLYDMIGNVCHWTADYWGSYSGGGLIDPEGPPPSGGRVARGGSWLHGKTVCFRLSSRYGQGTAGGFRFNNLGFRCVVKH
jgi:formylglycine-generating enzyme required for sulfatase activity